MEEAGRKRDGKGGRDRGAATRKKIDPVTAEWREQMMAESRRLAKEESEKYEAEFRAKYPNEEMKDLLAVQARKFRGHWEYVWGSLFGSFEDISHADPTHALHGSACAGHCWSPGYSAVLFCQNQRNNTGLTVPLHVFGIVAARDPIDHNRNIIFSRERSNCQSLTQEDPYLKLTGPSRAVVVCDPVDLEVALKVKGSVKPEDKDLSLLAVPLIGYDDFFSTRLFNKVYTSKLSTLEVKFGYIVDSVEATISVHVTEGSWPDGFYGHFTAQTSSLEHERVSLLGYKIPVDDDGMIKLSRSVASVELEGKLKVSVAAFRYDKDLDKTTTVGEDEEGFRPMKAGRNTGRLDVGFCKMDVTVAWSLMSVYPCTRRDCVC